MNKHVCIHGHFYQPPRENAWLEEIELQESAYPYDNWNERVTAECYAPNTASRIVNPEGMIIDIVNNYSKISFNFGPTLMSWMEKHAAVVYDAVINADKKSIERFGHGSAIAQVYNHMIMPLANKEDKQAQVKWGIADFEKRFKRYPEGMWLPETAVDLEALEVMAAHNIKFTILASHQASRIRKISGHGWSKDSEIDTNRAYLCKLPSGKCINIFFYNGEISKEVAFNSLLNNGEVFANRLVESFSDESSGQIVNIATDGETYGHHHKYGDMGLAYCLYFIHSNNLATTTNYSAFLEKFPAEYEVQINENTSWSCSHGIERWKGNCGCSTRQEWHQEWREPLRNAFDWLRDKLRAIFESEGAKYLKDPWAARDDYILVVLDRSKKNVVKFINDHATKNLNEDESKIALKLLEMQRHAMLMYTSCGWFFDDISGIETVQVIQYAARSMQLAKEAFNLDLEDGFKKILVRAPSNVEEFKDGAGVFDRLVKPASVDLVKVAAHYAISSIFQGRTKRKKVYSFNVKDEAHTLLKLGKIRILVGRSIFSSEITWEEKAIDYCALWLGDHNVYCGVKEGAKRDTSSIVLDDIKPCFEDGDIKGMTDIIDKYYGTNNYSLKDLFKDEQTKIIRKILQDTLRKAETLYKKIFEENAPVIHFLHSAKVSHLKELQVALDVVISTEIREQLASKEVDLKTFKHLVDDALRYSINFDVALISLRASKKIDGHIKELEENPEDIEKMERIEKLISLLEKLPIELNLWQSQNILFLIGKRHYKAMEEKKNNGDSTALKWLNLFGRISNKLAIKMQR
jgi:alpha-amylase/alpha-mannosidase (GH57 family)